MMQYGKMIFRILTEYMINSHVRILPPNELPLNKQWQRAIERFQNCPSVVQGKKLRAYIFGNIQYLWRDRTNFVPYRNARGNPSGIHLHSEFLCFYRDLGNKIDINEI